MSAFKRLPVPPLPDRALGSTDDLLEWAAPLLQHTWGESYWSLVYFFLSFKITLAVLSSLVMIRLLYMGEFWIVRAVKVRRGTILVPKATDAVIFFGACFIACDAAYRVKAIQWFRGPTYEPLKRYAVLEGLRLSPAWLASWVHLCASSLIWPLQLDKIRPLYWHLVFFGGPLLFIFTYLTQMIITDRYVEKGQTAYILLARELLAAPGAPLTQWMKDQALEFHDNIATSAHFCEYWMVIGSVWIFVVLVGELVVGTVLLSRVYKAYAEISANPAQHEPMKTWCDPAVSAGVVAKPSALQEPEPQPKITLLRLAKYLAGVAPLSSTKPEVLEPLPPVMVKRILRSFFLHSLVELFCLCTLLTIILAAISYMAARTYVAVRENVYDARFGNQFMRATYMFHVTEMMAVVVLCSTLTASMLKRSAFPLRIQPKQSHESYTTGSNRQHTLDASDEGAQGQEEEQEAMSAAGIKTGQRSPPASGRSASPREWLAPSHHAGSATSIMPLAASASNSRRGGELLAHSRFAESITSHATLRMPFIASTEEEDVSWYAGHAAGRSIVLAALASGQRNDLGAARGRKAAWRTTYTDPARSDIEAPSPTARSPVFATSHGHGVVPAAIPMQELCKSPDSSTFLTADTTVYASSPTRETGFSFKP